MKRSLVLVAISIIIWSGAVVFSGASKAMAHCDTISGPVVAAAGKALKTGDLTPVLKWVQPQQEAEVKDAFARVMTVRTAGPEARELADRFFF
jgi:hypothetical protein